jgi:hypothetical protein
MEMIEKVDSSKIFGGTDQSISVFEDHVLINTPRQQGPDTVELRYERMVGVSLYTGVFYATLILRTGNGYGLMIRWLPKGKAIRVANFIGRHMRPT